jgi:hypothetical protein
MEYKMFKKGDIVKSRLSEIHYELLEDEFYNVNALMCEALEDSSDLNRWSVKKGDQISLRLRNLISDPLWIIPYTAIAVPPFKVGDFVEVFQSPDEAGIHLTPNCWVSEMDKYCRDGKLYEVVAVREDPLLDVGGGYQYFFPTECLRYPAAMTQGYGAAAEEDTTEENDPYGLIAQRRALRSFIGE